MNISVGEVDKEFLSKKMFGLFFEDINYGADGGLYAEMLENKQFAFRKAYYGKAEKTYDTEYAGDYGWSKYPTTANSKMSFLEGDALSENNPHYMRFVVEEDRAGFVNKAYDGICLKKGLDYLLTIWTRSKEYAGKLVVKALNRQDGSITAQNEVLLSKGDWTKYTVKIKAQADLKDGLFVIEQEKGAVDYGYISLMPEDAVEGVFRKDLFEMIKATNPGFLRFPGGCIVEGANLDNRYRWKDTVGLPWERKWNWSRWAVHDVTMGQGNPLFYPFYNQSYGIGFYEYFLLSELMGAKALPVLSVGLACQFQSDELVPIDSTEFDEYIQDALDLIEFANGSESTKWGKLRAQMGHPAPFGLEYVGIGNEQWETEKVDFFARYSAFEKAIHSKYPKIRLIGSAGPDVTTDKYTRAWDFYRKEMNKNSQFTHAVDEHYYMPPAWFYEHVNMYDSYSRDIPVFAGEYAAHCEKKQNSLEAALAEAAFMCGLERNGDVIRFASAAPLFARKGYTQWIPDYIWFDGDTVMGTPGYYVQKMFGAYTGYQSHKYTADLPEKTYFAVSSDDKKMYVKIINADEKAYKVSSLDINGKVVDFSKINICSMGAADIKTENVLGEPEKVFLKKVSNVGSELEIAPFSCNVLELNR